MLPRFDPAIAPAGTPTAMEQIATATIRPSPETG